MREFRRFDLHPIIGQFRELKFPLDACPNFYWQAFSRPFIYYGKQLELLSIGATIVNEIISPHLISSAGQARLLPSLLPKRMMEEMDQRSIEEVVLRIEQTPAALAVDPVEMIAANICETDAEVGEDNTHRRR